MLGAFTGYHAHSRCQTCIPLQSPFGQLKREPGERFAADFLHEDHVGQPGVVHANEFGAFRIVLSHNQFVVKVIDQLLFEPLQAAEINAPIPIVQRIAFEDKLERKRVAVQKRAMRMRRPPLTKARAQTEIVPVCLR